VANEAFAHVRIDQLLKDADWSLTDGRSVRSGCPPDDDGQANNVLYGCQSRAGIHGGS
jgi:type I restriction enzyme R subunit